jgi:hypothetical protein
MRRGERLCRSPGMDLCTEDLRRAGDEPKWRDETRVGKDRHRLGMLIWDLRRSHGGVGLCVTKGRRTQENRHDTVVTGSAGNSA